MSKQLARLLLAPHAEVLVLCPTQYAMKQWHKDLAEEMALRHEEFQATMHNMTVESGTSRVRFVNVFKASDTLGALAGLRFTNIVYSFYLRYALGPLLETLATKLRSTSFAGPFTIEPYYAEV